MDMISAIIELYSPLSPLKFYTYPSRLIRNKAEPTPQGGDGLTSTPFPPLSIPSHPLGAQSDTDLTFIMFSGVHPELILNQSEQESARP